MTIQTPLTLLINTIAKTYELPELYDVNFNLVKRDISCPDSITHFLLSLQGNFSLASNVNYHNELGAVKYDVIVFYYKFMPNNSLISQIHLTDIQSKDLYNQLEEFDFFKDTNLFAISISKNNSVFPEIYIYSIN